VQLGKVDPGLFEGWVQGCRPLVGAEGEPHVSELGAAQPYEVPPDGVRRVEPHEGLEARERGGEVFEAVQHGALLVPEVVVAGFVRGFTGVERSSLVQIGQRRTEERVAARRLHLPKDTLPRSRHQKAPLPLPDAAISSETMRHTCPRRFQPSTSVGSWSSADVKHATASSHWPRMASAEPRAMDAATSPRDNGRPRHERDLKRNEAKTLESELARAVNF
jgi:hypothetical protein